MDVFIKAAEYMEMPVRRSDDEPLQKLFVAVRSELNLDLKNIKTEQAKFWKQHPSLVKVGLFWLDSMIHKIWTDLHNLKSSTILYLFILFIADGTADSGASHVWVICFDPSTS